MHAYRMCAMSARRGQRELRAGVERLGKLLDDMVENHTSISTPRRSVVSVTAGAVSHIAILCFTVIVVWTAQPSSSKLPDTQGILKALT